MSNRSCTRLILLRHGQTDLNAQGIFQGQFDEPLNSRGREQAKAASRQLAKISIDSVYASTLSRARETAEIVANRIGLSPHFDIRLVEVDVGSWQGMSWSSVIQKNPDFAEALDRGIDVRRSPTGETGTELGVRVGSALTEIAQANLAQTVLVVSHGLAIKMGIGFLLEWDYATVNKLCVMVNCAWSTLELRGTNQWSLAGLNQHAF